MRSVANVNQTTIQFLLNLWRRIGVTGDELITTAEAGALLGITASRVRQLLYDREVPIEKKGSVILIRRSQLALLTDRNPVGRPPKPK